jgi:hypothetical protein
VLMVVMTDSCERLVEGNRRLRRITNRDPWPVAWVFRPGRRLLEPCAA